MKKRTRENIAKAFALVVVIIMVFQVLLPLFNSLNYGQTAANVTSASVGTESVVTPVTTPTVTTTTTPAVTTETSATSVTPAPVTK